MLPLPLVDSTPLVIVSAGARTWICTGASPIAASLSVLLEVARKMLVRNRLSGKACGITRTRTSTATICGVAVLMFG